MIEEKTIRIHIADIRIGDVYKHLPSGQIKVFEEESDIAFSFINPENYCATTDDLDGRDEYRY